MPTYEYECKTCGHTFDVFQSMSDALIKICPQCGKEVRRLINGGSGVIFKGSGFYVTDKSSRSGKTKTANTAGSDQSAAKSPAPAGPEKSGSAAGSEKSGSTAGGGESAAQEKKAAGK
jgi:putative FmdB family regulatory protein